MSRALRQVQGIEEADVRLTLNLARIVLPRSTARALAEDAKVLSPPPMHRDFSGRCYDQNI